MKGLIADCGFQSMERQMRDMADNWFHLHYIPLLLKEMNCLCHFVAGFRMKDADTTEAMKRNTKTCPFLSWREGYLCVPEQFIPELYAVQSTKGTGSLYREQDICAVLCRSGTVQRTVMEFFEKYDGSNSEK